MDRDMDIHTTIDTGSIRTVSVIGPVVVDPLNLYIISLAVQSLHLANF